MVLCRHTAVLIALIAALPTGCGIRITGEAAGDLWINVLLSVFAREAKAPTAMFKVVVRKVVMKDGAPLSQDGRVVYADVGNIRKAWLVSGSGVRLEPAGGGEAPHGDGYMTSLDFGHAMNLLADISHTNFQVGFSRNETEPDTVFEFNQRMSHQEAGTLTTCMKNLRDAMEENKNGKIL